MFSAYAGARGAEYGTNIAMNECNQVVLNAHKLESDLCPPTCAIRAAAAGGRGKVPI